MTIENITIVDPDDFVYFSSLGKGGFGRVRKCIPKVKLLELLPRHLLIETKNENGEIELLLPPLDSEADQNLIDRISEICSNFEAVKILTKYDLLLNKVVQHLFNEIFYMADVSHPLILNIHSVA